MQGTGGLQAIRNRLAAAQLEQPRSSADRQWNLTPEALAELDAAYEGRNDADATTVRSRAQASGLNSGDSVMSLLWDGNPSEGGVLLAEKSGAKFPSGRAVRSIRIDKVESTRAELQDRRLATAQLGMEHGHKYPPIKVRPQNSQGNFEVQDGNHRLEAARRLGKARINAEVAMG
mmetsp:Transcript_29493/g.70173  ORF Transcript_29493/g.70173 Transcript_29493/m.70173 type:complete len:175 (+) Transcript_29493:414-938(+)